MRQVMSIIGVSFQAALYRQPLVPYTFPMKKIILLFALTLGTNAFAKPSKIHVQVYSCPHKQESGGCHKQETMLIDKNVEVSFTPLKSKNGLVDSEESKKHVFVSEKINGMIFELGARSDDKFLRKGKPETTPEYGLIVLNVRLNDHEGLHYSDHAYFTDKSTNYFHIPLRTNDSKNDYFAEVRSL